MQGRVQIYVGIVDNLSLAESLIIELQYGNPAAVTTRSLSGELCPRGYCSKSRPKVSIKFFLHASGNIAAKFVYNEVLVGALRRVPKASWNAKERLWVFPLSSLSEAEKVMKELTSFNIEVETLDPLLQRAIASASAVPDLRDRYDQMPDSIKSNLLPFQREGVSMEGVSSWLMKWVLERLFSFLPEIIGMDVTSSIIL
ncbi:hypothetical protein L1987_09004 [Smallanthus sonchifolius]|uniref:Uncharacterized protein n=1 Tax=Smallanthus sonchifolius TaxID=185202 RepID=A0ACB9JMS1_9ASTR|nr:hypothetical protein L1987_09004 [Smallanthus sonchifolius]